MPLSLLLSFSNSIESGDGVAGVFGMIGDSLDDALQMLCGDVGSSNGRFVWP
jgi:hypothetical protein